MNYQIVGELAWGKNILGMNKNTSNFSLCPWDKQKSVVWTQNYYRKYKLTLTETSWSDLFSKRGSRNLFSDTYRSILHSVFPQVPTF